MARTFEHLSVHDQALLRAMLEVRGEGVGMLRGWRQERISESTLVKIQPQMAVRIRRLLMPPQDADNWVIHDIRIGNVRTGNNGPIPGGMFTPAAYDATLELPPASAGMEIAVEIEYVGGDPAGGTFMGTFLCETVDGARGTRALPIGPVRVPYDARNRSGLRVHLQLDDRTWCIHSLVNRAWETSIEASDDRIGQHDDRRVRRCDGKEVLVQGATGMMTDAGDRVYEPVGSSMSPEPTIWAVDPLPVSLHVADMPGPTLFGIDERTNRVVFEIASRTVSQRKVLPGERRRVFGAKLDVYGYEPEWWGLFHLLESPLA